MIIKKYLANTVEEALSLVKQELGSNHVILTTRQVEQSGLLGWFSAKKVEVTAAVEEEDLKAHTQGKLGKKRKKEVHLPDLNENLRELQELVKEEPEVPVAPAPMAAPSMTYGDPRLNKPKPKEVSEKVTALQGTTDRLLSAFADSQPEERKEVPREVPKVPPMTSADELRRIIREEMRGAQKPVSVGPLENNDEETVGSVRFLMSKGVGRKKAVAIEEKLTNLYGKVDLSKASTERTQRINAMKGELAASITTTGPIRLSGSEPTLVALVGPTGVGKTTTLAKLAAHYRQTERKKVALISLDNVKLGAREQIEAISREHALPVRTAVTAEELKEAIAAFYDQDLILIDTGGRSQYQSTEVNALGELLTKDPRIQIYLALSATTKDVDCIGIVNQFTRMPIKGLIFTKLDETIAYGMMVMVCENSGLPISYVTNGQKIPRDLEVANSDEIAKSILMQHNSAACNRIREMASA